MIAERSVQGEDSRCIAFEVDGVVGRQAGGCSFPERWVQTDGLRLGDR
jgi:hypothetical protein